MKYMLKTDTYSKLLRYKRTLNAKVQYTYTMYYCVNIKMNPYEMYT